MIDNLKVMANSTDAEFSRLLGVEMDWTKFVIDTLLSRRERSDNALFEDIATDIVADLILALSGQNSLAEKVMVCRASAGSDNELLNMLKPLIATAVHYRFRDFRRRPAAQIGHCEMPEGVEVMAQFVDVGNELDAESLVEMIHNELAHRQATTAGMEKSSVDWAIEMLPDRIDGLGIRAICEKHGWGRGRRASMALQEIYKAVEVVATKLQEGWMLSLIRSM